MKKGFLLMLSACVLIATPTFGDISNDFSNFSTCDAGTANITTAGKGKKMSTTAMWANSFGGGIPPIIKFKKTITPAACLPDGQASAIAFELAEGLCDAVQGAHGVLLCTSSFSGMNDCAGSAALPTTYTCCATPTGLGGTCIGADPGFSIVYSPTTSPVGGKYETFSGLGSVNVSLIHTRSSGTFLVDLAPSMNVMLVPGPVAAGSVTVTLNPNAGGGPANRPTTSFAVDGLSQNQITAAFTSAMTGFGFSGVTTTPAELEWAAMFSHVPEDFSAPGQNYTHAPDLLTLLVNGTTSVSEIEFVLPDGITATIENLIVPTTTAIPTLSTWGIMVLGGILVLASGWLMARRRRLGSSHV
jgi:hypothetical protein